MVLSSDLTSLFVKNTKDDAKTKVESTVYGTVVVQDSKTWVKLDGSDLLTPFTSTAHVTDGERVTVMIKNHTATVTGNTTSPSAKHSDLEEVSGDLKSIKADYAEIGELVAKKADIDELIADTANIKELTANTAVIKDLVVNKGTFDDLVADSASIISLAANEAVITDLVAKKGTFDDLVADSASIISLVANKAIIDGLVANDAHIKDLVANVATLTSLNSKYAAIDFANVGQLAAKDLMAKSGHIQFFTAEDGTVTGELIAVKINADSITAGSLLAERILMQGDNGLFYKLNLDAMGKTVAEALPDDQQEKLREGIHGKSIIAESITADKISVSDLNAFRAKIGGFSIGEKSIYSDVKSSVDNTTPGIYMDSDGQLYIGDSNNYIRFYKPDDEYKLEISTVDRMQIGARNLIRNSTNLVYGEYTFGTYHSAADDESTGILGKGVLGKMILGKEA